MAINLNTLLNDSGGKAMVERYLDKAVLKRRQWNATLANSKWAETRGIPVRNGQYIRLTRKRRMRRPETMASPGGAGSDPASGAQLNVDQLDVPLEWHRDYAEIATVSQMTSWLDLKSWVREDFPVAQERRLHELTQNAFHVGRMTPGVYGSDGATTTPFDRTAEASVNLYGNDFTFARTPRYYANGKKQFNDLEPSDTIKWNDLRRARVRMANAGAPTMGGYMMCDMSEAMWNDLIQDDDNGRLNAAMAGGLQTVIKGLENQTTYKWAGWIIKIDDQPLTVNSDDEVARADFGEIHTAICYGMNCFGYVPLGKFKSMRTRFKIQDITKVGHQFTVGYMFPWQVAILNAGWGCTIKGAVSEQYPNNYDEDDPNRYLEGFEVDPSATS